MRPSTTRSLLAWLVLSPAFLPLPAQSQTPATPAPWGAAAEVASLRPLVVVEDTVVRLGDLFENAGARAGVSIGAAPAPGRRFVVEAAQLYAIARQNGVAWRPMTANERAVVERPGKPVPREDIDAALRQELMRLGLDEHAELELGAFQAPMVPASALVQVTTESVSYDPVTHRFGATLVMMADGMPTQRQRLAGRAVETVPVVLATRRLGLGERVGPGDVRLARLRVERVRPGAMQRVDQVIGQQLRRPVANDMPFNPNDVGPPPVVEKNTLVTLLVESAGLSLTAQGRALENAPAGGAVPVMNLVSRTVVEGVAIGPGRVRVTMGAMPVVSAARGPGPDFQ